MAGSERATFVLVWLACLTLLAATVGVSRLDLGPWNVVLNLTIAAAKAGLIVWFYMELREDRPLVRIFAIGGLFWVALLFGLGLSDWLTRGPW